MDIILTDEQTLLRDSVGKLLQDRYEFPAREAIRKSDVGFAADLWSTFAELGLFAAPFSEAAGGIGLGVIGTMIVAEEFGRKLVLEPFVESVVVAGSLIEAGATPDQQAKYLPNIISGEEIWVLAATEARTRGDYSKPQTKAARVGDGFRIEGTKAAVVAAPWASKLLVSARVDQGELGFFVVDRNAENLRLTPFRTVDGRRAAELTLEGVFVDVHARLGAASDGVALFEHCRERAIAALSAEAIGAMSELVRMTVEYAKTRKQFGVPIGSFQVLQHRMVDMFIALQEATAITNLFTATLTRDSGAHSALASATKAKVGDAARFVGEQAIQIHGGMGMSEELSVGHYAKRLAAINIQFGDSDYHQSRFGAAAIAA